MKHSGKFVLRVPPSLHKELVARAHKEDTSLNAMCLQLITSALHPTSTSTWSDILAPVIHYLQTHYDKNLLGIIVFGSQVSGAATEESDLDLLVVLSNTVQIRRGLYREWDNEAPQISDFVLDPHFTHLPSDTSNVGAVWLEAATSGEVIYDPQNKIQKTLSKLKQPIESGKIRRGWSHGHPYWIRSENEKY